MINNLALFIAAALAVTTVSAVNECFEQLEKDCATVRKERTECADCVRKHESDLKMKNCTVTEERYFCEGAPRPNVTCYHELEAVCGKERSSEPACIKCVEEHDMPIRKANCTASEVDLFCHKKPPTPNECMETLYKDCEKVRADKTECLECAKKVGPAAHCTEASEEAFCSGAPHNMTCLHELELDCGNDRHNKSLCFKCLEQHAEDLEKAHCTKPEAEHFCEGAKPPAPPSAECERVLMDECGADRKNESLCFKCEKRHENQTKAAKCTYSQLTSFCKEAPPPPPGPKCSEVLEKDCGVDRKNITMCDRCLREHSASLRAAHCTETEEKEFCKPTPPNPTADCVKTFDSVCGQETKNKTLCIHCADEHAQELREHHCSAGEIDKLCHVPAPPGPSPETCMRALESDCGSDRKNQTMCKKCVETHRDGLKKAGCTAAEAEGFCAHHPVPPPPPSQACEKVLEIECGKERHNRTLCHKCLEVHHAELEKAHCTYSQEVKFCNVTTDECGRELVAACGSSKMEGEKQCFDCLKKYASTFEKVHCSITEEEEYCKTKAIGL